MNYKYKKLKLQDCGNIINSKNRGTLTVCCNDKPYSELVFYDTDCFCGCFMVYFKICKCGKLVEALENDNYATLFITRKCNNNIETVELTGQIENVVEDNCCCKKKDDCFQLVKMNIDTISGKCYYQC